MRIVSCQQVQLSQKKLCVNIGMSNLPNEVLCLFIVIYLYSKTPTLYFYYHCTTTKDK
jgi:hypothetical protein